jgi:hypothetical protein
MYGRNRLVNEMWQRCVWQLRGSNKKRLKKSFCLQTRTKSPLMTIWYCEFSMVDKPRAAIQTGTIQVDTQNETN